MILDLQANAAYKRHHEWLFPRAARGGNGEVLKFYTSLWALADNINPMSFHRAKTDIIPALTNGKRMNPDRSQVLSMISRVRSNDINLDDVTELAAATMLATRAQRWELLAAHVKSEVPNEFRLYRYVHGIEFCADVTRQFDRVAGGLNELKLIHDEWTPWSLTRRGALSFRDTRPGVLYTANIPFDRTVADILVDDSSFQKVYCRQAEMLVTAPEDTLVTLAGEVAVFMGGKEFGAHQWADMWSYLKKQGRRF